MYKYFFISIYLGCIFTINVYANECKNINMFSNNNNVTIQGNVNISISCVKKQSKEKKKEITKLIKKIHELDKNLEIYKEYNGIYQKYGEELVKLRKQLLSSKKELTFFKNYINEYNLKLNIELNNLKNKISIRGKEYSNKIQKNKHIIENIRDEININLNKIDNELENIEKKIDINSKNINVNKVNIKVNTDKIKKIDKKQRILWTYFNDTSDKYYGLILGSVYLNNNIGVIEGFEVESFNRTLDSSLFLNLVGIQVDYESEYTTLGSLQETINNDKKFYSLDIGWKYFFNTDVFHKSDKIYLGLSIGGITGSDDSLIASIQTGFEYYHNADSKIVLELGTKYIDEVSSQEVSFNSLGKSTLKTINDNELFSFILLKYLWRL